MPALKFDPRKIKASPASKAVPEGFSLVGQASENRDAVQVPLSLIDPYTDPQGQKQPFQMYGADAMAQLVESVIQRGVLTPVLLRPVSGGRYQTLAGHNRIEAAKQAGLSSVPAVIRECDDDEAALAVVDTNLQQRQHLLPSERAKAYRIKMNALNRKGQRSDLFGEGRYDAAAQIAEEASESKRNVFRYLRLNELEAELLNKVDAGKISVEAGGDLSYLTEQQQRLLERTMLAEEIERITPHQAKDLREYGEAEQLTYQKINEILGCVKEEKPQILTIKIPVNGLLDAQELKLIKKHLKQLQDDPDFAEALLAQVRKMCFHVSG